jgi:hypothetical protein
LLAEGTYVKLIWAGIDKEHQHLCPNGYNWNRRTDLKHRFGKELSELPIQEAWKWQEKRFNDWKRGHPLTWRYQTINFMKFPREVIDHISILRAEVVKYAAGETLSLSDFPSYDSTVMQEIRALQHTVEACHSPALPLLEPHQTDPRLLCMV